MKRFALLFGGIAAMALLGAGCTAQKAADSAVKAKVGVMVPFSGDAASYGESVRKGVELAQKDLGLTDVELEFEDSKCEGKDAATAVNKLVSIDKVVAIVGELCSGASLAAAPVAEQNKVVMVSPASTAPNYSDAGDYIFRTVPSDLSQGAFGAKLLADKGLKKLAVLYTNDDYGVGFDKVLKDEFPKLGGEVVASEAAERKAVDVRTQLTKIKAANPDSLYIISNSPDTAAAALKQAKELGLSVTVVGSEGLKEQKIIDAAQGAAEGMIVTAVTAGVPAFIEKHKTAYGGAEPGPFAAQGYDAFKALGEALKAGAKTGEEIKNKLYELEFDGMSGKINFDEKGDVSGNYNVYVVKEGKFELPK